MTDLVPPVSVVEILSPRDVPLGGLRAMSVRRTLPHRERSLIGAWCFVDHYGPDDLESSEPMVVPPHPHTGLATVSWLFSGEIEHRDSAGNHALVRPGELNLMTAGRGISHSEYSLHEPGEERSRLLHGCQLWFALPDTARGSDPGFEHFAPDPITGDRWQARVFLGSLLGATSPVRTHAPLLGAELRLEPGASLTVPVQNDFEHGLLVDHGEVYVEAEPVAPGDLGYLPPGRGEITITSQTGALLLLLGGPPFDEQIVMWWNFIGRTHEEIVEYRTRWQSLLATGADDRFALPEHDPQAPLDAPPMPSVRLRSRG